MKAFTLICVASLSAASLSAQDAATEQAVDAIVQTFADGWNRGDAAAFTSVYAEDADGVGFTGVSWRGRAAGQDTLSRTMELYTGNTLGLARTGLHELAPDVVVLDGTWEFSGGTIPEDAPSNGFFTWILAKQGDAWQVVAHRVKAPPQN